MNLAIQNNDKSLQLLAAQDRLYANAKTWFYLAFVFPILPLIGMLLNPFLQIMDDFLTIAGVFGLVLALVIDRFVKNKIEKAACIQEEFDTDVFELPWNEGLVGVRISKESRIKAASDFKIEQHRLPWYTEEIGTLPDTNLQVLLCQRESIMWDRQLKKHISNILAWVLGISLSTLVLWGLYSNPPFQEWFKLILIPASGFLVGIWKLWKSFQTVGNFQEDLNQSLEAEIEAYRKNKSQVSLERLRLFQDKTYKCRREICLVPGSIYKILQTGYQSRTTKATIEYINELKA